MPDFTDWLENTFGDGAPTKRWRCDVTVRVLDIEPPRICTAEEAEQYARVRVRAWLGEAEDFEIVSVTAKTEDE